MDSADPGTAATRKEQFDAWLQALSDRPYRFDFYQVMRRFAAAHPHFPRLGEALRPADEPLRVAQSAELDFAPAALDGMKLPPGQPPRLQQRMFGLIGPNGPLPTHLTEYARDRVRSGDRTFLRFLDTLTHRFALLFYRAWAEAQPIVSLDRYDNKACFNRFGSLVGIGLATLQDRDALPDASRIFFAGRLARQARDAEGLLAWIRTEFDVPVTIEQWNGHWMALMHDERSRLGKMGGALLGRSAVLGSTVWDVQHKFRVTVGPLNLVQYGNFLPKGEGLRRLHSLVRSWTGIELAWDLKLILAHAEIPRLVLGSLPTRPDPNLPKIAAGDYMAELISAESIDTAQGQRVALGFRIDRKSQGCLEITISIPAKNAAQSCSGALLTALAEGLRRRTEAGGDPEPRDAANGQAGGDVPGPWPTSVSGLAEWCRRLIGSRCKLRLGSEPAPGGPRVVAGARMGLGHSTWLGRRLTILDADDLRLNVERPTVV